MLLHSPLYSAEQPTAAAAPHHTALSAHRPDSFGPPESFTPPAALSPLMQPPAPPAAVRTLLFPFEVRTSGKQGCIARASLEKKTMGLRPRTKRGRLLFWLVGSGDVRQLLRRLQGAVRGSVPLQRPSEEVCAESFERRARLLRPLLCSLQQMVSKRNECSAAPKGVREEAEQAEQAEQASARPQAGSADRCSILSAAGYLSTHSASRIGQRILLLSAAFQPSLSTGSTGNGQHHILQRARAWPMQQSLTCVLCRL